MKDRWVTKPIGELCDILDSRRKPVTKRDRITGHYPYYGATGIVDYVNDYIFDDELVLVGEDGAKWASGENTAFRVKGKCWINNHAHVLKPRQDMVLDNWLVYFLNHSDLHEFVSGLTVPKLNQGSLRGIPIPLPPLPEQKRIVAILDEAFAGIGQAIANTERNLKNARELFESYLNDVFTRKGEGWFVTTISDLVEKRILAKPLDGNHGDVHPKKVDFIQDGVPFIMASDLIDGDVDQIHCNHISRKQADALRKGFARDGDVLLTHKGTIGRSAVLSTQHDYVMLTPQVTYFRVIDSNIMSNRFLYFCFKSNIFQDEICEIAGKGSTRAYVGITRQLDLHVSYPPLDEQLLLVAAFDSLFSAAQRLEAIYQQKLTALAELKQSILQKAFTGQLTDSLPL